MIASDLYAIVRRELGKITVGNIVDITDADILDENLKVLQDIGDKITKKVRRSFTTTACVGDYAVADTTVRVLQVFPGDNISLNDLALNDPEPHSVIVEPGAGEPDNPYDFPSMAVIDAQRRRKGLPKIRFDYNPVERVLKIEPMPITGGLTFWYLSVEKSIWLLSSIPEDFVNLMIDGTVARCLEIVMLRRSTEGGIMRSGGQVDYPADRMKPFISDRQAKFEKALYEKAMLYNI